MILAITANIAFSDIRAYPSPYGLNVTIIFGEMMDKNMIDTMMLALMEYTDTIQSESSTKCDREYEYDINDLNNVTMVNMIILACNAKDQQFLISRYENENIPYYIIPPELSAEVMVKAMDEPVYQEEVETTYSIKYGGHDIIKIGFTILAAIVICLFGIAIHILIKCSRKEKPEHDTDPPPNSPAIKEFKIRTSKTFPKSVYVSTPTMLQHKKKDSTELYNFESVHAGYYINGNNIDLFKDPNLSDFPDKEEDVEDKEESDSEGLYVQHVTKGYQMRKSTMHQKINRGERDSVTGEIFDQ